MQAIDQHKSPSGTRTEPTQIVIVDDEPVFSAVICRYLKDAGFEHSIGITEPTTAVDRILEDVPELILLDIHMPGLSGFEILEALRSHANGKRIPVLMLTADEDAKTKKKAFDLGATDFLAKPIDATELIARVRNVLDASKTRATKPKPRPRVDVYERREPRYRVKRPKEITSFVVGNDADQCEQLPVRLADLSCRGACLLSESSIPVGQSVNLTLQVDKLNIDFTISGGIRWSKIGPRADWHTGCAFVTDFPKELLEQLAAAGLVERRIDERKSISLAAKVKRELDNGNPIPVRIVEYSSGGLRLSSTESVTLEQRLLLEVDTTCGKSVCIPVRPLWQRTIAGGRHVGCSFLNKDGYRQLLECVPQDERRDPVQPAASHNRPRQLSPVTLVGCLALAVVFFCIGLAERPEYRGTSPTKEGGLTRIEVVPPATEAQSTPLAVPESKSPKKEPTAAHVIADHQHTSAETIEDEINIEPRQNRSEPFAISQLVAELGRFIPTKETEHVAAEHASSDVQEHSANVVITDNDNSTNTSAEVIAEESPPIDLDALFRGVVIETDQVYMLDEDVLNDALNDTSATQPAEAERLPASDHAENVSDVPNASNTSQQQRQEEREATPSSVPTVDATPMEENSPSPADSESIASGEQFEMREWTDNTGQYRVRAKLVDLSDDHVQLLKENGTLSNVPIKRLSETDQRYISEIRASY